MLSDIFSGRGAILDGAAAADVKVFMLGDIVYDTMSRAVLPVGAPAVSTAL